jgi:hypothetical protein
VARPPGLDEVMVPPAIGLVRGEQHRRPSGRLLFDQLAQQATGGRVQSGVGLVQQPELRGPGDQGGQGHPSALPRREPADRRAAEAADQAQPLEGRVDPVRRVAERTGGEADVLSGGQLVVEGRGMPEQADAAAHRHPVLPQVTAEDHSGARAHVEETSACAQEGRLPRAVRTEHDDHLAGLDREIDTGEGGEPTGKRHGGTEFNDGGHGRTHATGAEHGQAKRPPPGRAPRTPCLRILLLGEHWGPRRSRPAPTRRTPVRAPNWSSAGRARCGA